MGLTSHLLFRFVINPIDIINSCMSVNPTTFPVTVRLVIIIKL